MGFNLIKPLATPLCETLLGIMFRCGHSQFLQETDLGWCGWRVGEDARGDNKYMHSCVNVNYTKHKNYSETARVSNICDFQRCDILTSVDSDEPMQPPF